VLSDSDDDDNVDNEKYSDLSLRLEEKYVTSDSKTWEHKQWGNNDKSDIYAAGGRGGLWHGKKHYSKFEKFLKKIQEWNKYLDCINASEELPTDLRKYMLKKIIGGGQGKRRYPAMKCRACKKRGEMH
jgi:hypothetical protein